MVSGHLLQWLCLDWLRRPVGGARREGFSAPLLYSAPSSHSIAVDGGGTTQHKMGISYAEGLVFFSFFAPHSPHDQIPLGWPAESRHQSSKETGSAYLYTQTQTKTPHTTDKTTLTIVVLFGCGPKKTHKLMLRLRLTLIQGQLNTLTNVCSHICWMTNTPCGLFA